jgi:excisionase family DNA binding protein
MQPDRLLKFGVAAERLAVSLPTVKRLTAAGVLPVVRVGRAARVRESDVSEFIAKGAGMGRVGGDAA